MPLPRNCIKCYGRFLPSGRMCRLCDNCYAAVRNANFIKMIDFRNRQKGGKNVWKK